MAVALTLAAAGVARCRAAGDGTSARAPGSCWTPEEACHVPRPLSPTEGVKMSKPKQAADGVQVVSFVEKNSSKRKANAAGKSRKRPRNSRDEDAGGVQEFRSALRDVKELGAAQFEGYARKVYESARFEALGERPRRREKVPYRILLGKRKKLKKRLERKKAEEEK